MMTQNITPPQNDVMPIVRTAREHGYTVAQLCRAAVPPIHQSQIVRWLRGAEPRRAQVARLEAALAALLAPTTPTDPR